MVRNKLYRHQEKGLWHILSNDRCALWAECGLGKTLITIEALKLLPKPAIVIAPKHVANHTWPVELKKWWPTCNYSLVTGSPAKREKVLRSEADLYIINFEVIPWLVEGQPWVYRTVVIDESTRIKNRATRLFKSLRAVFQKWEHLIEMTGTPSPNGLMDLWSQLYLIDRGERLGKTITSFRDKWFNAGFMNWSFTPKDHARVEIEDLCRDVCLVLKADDYLDLPDMLVSDVLIDLPVKARTQYTQLKKELTVELKDKHVTAVNAAALVNKLLQFASGAAYDEESAVVVVHDEKIQAIRGIIDTIGDESLLLVYQFRHELSRLRIAFPQLVEVRDCDDTIKQWNIGEIRLLAIHPASAAHGLNLQAGGRHIVWMTPTWNLEHYIQVNARLHRIGQTKPVIVHRVIVAKTVDEQVVEAIENKKSVQDLLMCSLGQ